VAGGTGRLQGLDLLRGGAILLVILRHSWEDTFGWAGIVGVVAFFTLSGYLITGVLIRDIERYGHVRYGHFYRNRVLRLIPAMVFLLIAFVIVEGVFALSDSRDQVVTSVVVALLYVMNIPGFSHGIPVLGHLWTLANEEQFYLVWPLILVLGVRFRRLGIFVAITGVVIILGLVATMIANAPAIGNVYSHPAAWTVSMVIGAAAQLWSGRLSTVLHGGRASAAALVALVVLLGMSFIPESKDVPLTYLLGGPVIAVMTVALIVKLRDWAIAPTALRPLVWLGTISYAAYLWDFPLREWLRNAGVPGWQLWTIVLTLVAATVSWFVVERPFSAIKRKLDARLESRI
jgi:peptidoglycan/LPS O-acetylase OafA/YrhL